MQNLDVVIVVIEYNIQEVLNSRSIQMLLKWSMSTEFK